MFSNGLVIMKLLLLAVFKFDVYIIMDYCYWIMGQTIVPLGFNFLPWLTHEGNILIGKSLDP